MPKPAALCLSLALAFAAASPAAAQAPSGDYPIGSIITVGKDKWVMPAICGQAKGYTEYGTRLEHDDFLRTVESSSQANPSYLRGDGDKKITLNFASVGLFYSYNTKKSFSVSYFGPARLEFQDDQSGSVLFVAPPHVYRRGGAAVAPVTLRFANFKMETSGDDLLVSFGLRFETPDAHCIVGVRGAFTR